MNKETSLNYFGRKTEKETVIYDKSENTNPPSWSTMATDQRTSHGEFTSRLNKNNVNDTVHKLGFA